MYWLIAAVIVFVAELFTGTFYLLVVCAALTSAGLAQWLLDTPTVINIWIAAGCAAIGIAFVRRWQIRNRRPFGRSAADDPDRRQTVVLENALAGGLWQVRYRGAVWHARFTDTTHGAQSGGCARICGKEGNILLLEPPSSSSTTKESY